MPQALLAGLLAGTAGLVAALVAAWLYGSARATGKRTDDEPRRGRDTFAQYAALIGLLLSMFLFAAGIIVGVVQSAPGPTWARWAVAALLTAVALPVLLAVTARLADRAEGVRLRKIPAARPELVGRDMPSSGAPHREHPRDYERHSLEHAGHENRTYDHREYDQGHHTGGWRTESDTSHSTGGWPAVQPGTHSPAPYSPAAQPTGGWPAQRHDEPAGPFGPSSDAGPDPDDGPAVMPAMTYTPYDPDDDLVEDAPDTTPVEDAETLVRVVQPGLVYRDAAGSWFLGVADPYGVPRPLLRLPGFSATTAHEPVYPLDVMGSVEIAVLPLDSDGEEDDESRETADLRR
jgi:hypothetical protein